MKIIILLGRQGSGKGTQAEFLVKDFSFTHLGSGEIIRQRMQTRDFSGKKMEEVTARGGYLPTTVISMIWMEQLEALKKKPIAKGIIFDGSPRKLFEAELLDQAFHWYEWQDALQVILIDISREEAFLRLIHRRICQQCNKPIPWVGKYKNFSSCDACGGKLITRYDDTPSGINSRLDLFEKETEPVIGYYKQKGVLQTVRGDQAIDKVYQGIKLFVANKK